MDEIGKAVATIDQVHIDKKVSHRQKNVNFVPNGASTTLFTAIIAYVIDGLGTRLLAQWTGRRRYVKQSQISAPFYGCNKATSRAGFYYSYGGTVVRHKVTRSVKERTYLRSVYE